MRAQVEQTEIELQRLEVQALVDGEVLQVNVRPGEYVGAPPNQALVVLGSVQRLHVRVDVDEHDIPRFRPGAPARAMLRGDPRREFALRFVRVEPYVIPKKSLTGDNTERVDTRVLQVIYAVEDAAVRVYVGQQLDVYIDGEAK
jgi:multidrug resistance efflux pump